MQVFAKNYQQVSLQHSRDQLVLDHLDYVNHILNRIVAGLPDNVDIENLQSAGVVGLLEAANKFDPARGVSFKTFSYPRIRGAIFDEMRTNSPLSQNMMELVRTIRKTMENLEPPATAEKISELSGLPLAQVEDGLEAMRMNPQQLDTTHQELSKSLWSTERPEADSEHEENKQALADAIESLPERERLAITLYYLEGLKLKEIGAVLSISESRASRVLARAELNLKQKCNINF